MPRVRLQCSNENCICRSFHNIIFFKLFVQHQPVIFILDTGAEVSVMSKQQYDSLKNRPALTPTSSRLQGVNYKGVDVLGKITVKVMFRGRTQSLRMYVFENHTNLLGIRDMKKLGIIRIECSGLIIRLPTLRSTKHVGK